MSNASLHWRVWDVQRRQMLLDGFLLGQDGKLFISDIHVLTAYAPSYIVLFGTGAFDRNGMEGFEGDIVHMAKGWDGVITWSSSKNRFALRYPERKFTNQADGSSYSKVVWHSLKRIAKGVIIGNIYEMPAPPHKEGVK